MNKIIEKNMGEGTVYEFSSLFVPELDSAALSQIVNSIKEKIATLEGEIISEGEPVYIKLAYEVQKSINNKIKKVNFAHFAWIKFVFAPGHVAKFEKFVKEDLNESVMRYMLIKTVRENTVLTKLTEATLRKEDEDLVDEVIATNVAEISDAKDAVTDLGEEAIASEVTAISLEENVVEVK